MEGNQMSDEIDRMGSMSLRLAVAGIILPIITAIVVFILQDAKVIASGEPYIGLSALLFVGCQLLAFLTGRTCRTTRAGKIGFRIGLSSLVVAGICVVLAGVTWFFLSPDVVPNQ